MYLHIGKWLRGNEHVNLGFGYRDLSTELWGSLLPFTFLLFPFCLLNWLYRGSITEYIPAALKECLYS